MSLRKDTFLKKFWEEISTLNLNSVGNERGSSLSSLEVPRPRAIIWSR